MLLAHSRALRRDSDELLAAAEEAQRRIAAVRAARRRDPVPQARRGARGLRPDPGPANQAAGGDSERRPTGNLNK
jgi:hypothetical protein